MGSLEEEALIQMVHDFIESDSSSTNFHTSSNGFQVAENQATIITTLQEILLDMSQAEKKATESVLRHMGSRRTADRIGSNNLRKWLVMKMNVDGLTASLRQTSWVTSFGFPAGDYEYIEVWFRHGSGRERTRVIVDIDFRCQFELARPTPLYKRLTDTLPAIFVGSEDKLSKTMALLCAAAKQSLEERGLHVPPWRTAVYMRRKWLSTPNADDHRLGFGKWLPPAVGPKRGDKDFRGGSALSGQFESSLGINCC